MTQDTQRTVDPANATAGLGAQSPEHDCRAGVRQRRTLVTIDVGQLSQQELEEHIRSLGKLLERAYKLGDRANAVRLQRCMYEAIAARSPQRKAEMEAEIQRRIDEGASTSSRCRGRLDRARMLGGAA